MGPMGTGSRTRPNENPGGPGAAVALKPALQLAAVRTDRPDAGAAITAGSDITANGATHFRETPSMASKFWFRRSLSYKLTSGSFASCEVQLSTAFKQCAQLLPPVEVVFNPLNSTVDISCFPLSRVLTSNSADKTKAAVIIMDNATSTLDWRPPCRRGQSAALGSGLFGRAFNDPMAPGSWTALGSAWNAPQSGDTDLNTGELDIATALSLSSNQWFQLALAIRKGSAGEANCGAILHLIPAIIYS